MTTETYVACAMPILDRSVYGREERIAIRRGIEAALRGAGLRMQRRFPLTEEGLASASAEAQRMQETLDAAGYGDHRVQVNRSMLVSLG
jgi:hypothetical protein